MPIIFTKILKPLEWITSAILVKMENTVKWPLESIIFFFFYRILNLIYAEGSEDSWLFCRGFQDFDARWWNSWSCCFQLRLFHPPDNQMVPSSAMWRRRRVPARAMTFLNVGSGWHSRGSHAIIPPGPHLQTPFQSDD